jgi:hypothetical protein
MLPFVGFATLHQHVVKWQLPLSSARTRAAREHSLHMLMMLMLIDVDDVDDD